MTATDIPARGPRRAPILVVVAIALVAGVIVGRAETVRASRPPTTVDAAQLPGRDAVSTAWYCPGLPSSFPTADQSFTLSNVGSRDADVVVTVDPDSGADPIVRNFTVPHDTVQTFNRATLGRVSVKGTGSPTSNGSSKKASSSKRTSTKTTAGKGSVPKSLPPGPIVVEPFSPDVVVSAGVETDASLDVVPCADTASADWYFAAGTTVRGVSQWLVLDDPFSADARVNVTLRTDGGLQLLPSLQGIDVPGRSRVVIPIHNQAVRQAAVAVEVHAAVGKVVASQTLDFGGASGPKGVATALGALATSSQWWFTDGDVLAGSSQYVTIADMSQQLDARVVVQGLIGAQIVQPVVITVPSGSVKWVQIGSCARTAPECLNLPAESGYEIEVTSDANVPVVAQTLSRYTNAKIASGAVISLGSTTPSSDWLIPRTRVVDERLTSISLMNRGVKTAHVSASVVHNGVVDRPDDLQHLSIAPNARLVLPPDTAGATHIDDAAVMISSDVPLFAESTIYAQNDATRAPGVPAG